MAWGFKAINSGGAIQIDGDFSNMSMFLKGTINYNANDPYNPAAHGPFDVNEYGTQKYTTIKFPQRPNPPFVAVQPAGNGNYYGAIYLYGMLGVDQGGSRKVDGVRLAISNEDAYDTYDYARYPGGNKYQGPWPERIVQTNWALFDSVGDVLDDTDWGMQVFNDQEEVMFDSRASYLEVVDTVRYTKPPRKRLPGDGDDGYWAPDGDPVILSHVYQPNAWYIINSLGGQFNGAGGTSFFGPNVWSMRLRQHSTTSVEIAWQQILASTSDPFKTDTRRDGELIICKERFI